MYETCIRLRVSSCPHQRRGDCHGRTPERRFSARRFRGRVRLAGRLRPAHPGRLPRRRGAEPGPVVLVGHSYGGAVISEAGTDPNVAALVYIAAFAPDKGESVNTLIADPPPGAPVPP